MENAQTRHPSGGEIAVLTSIVVFGVLLRGYHLADPQLWFDEIYSVTLAEQGLLDAFLASLRFDLHPPAYYVQLSVWALFGDSDLWYILNSVAWDTARIALTAYVVYRLAGSRAAIMAALLAMFLAPMLYGASNVRMYPFMAFFTVLAWYSTERLVENAEQGRGSWTHAISLAVSIILVTTSHGAGPFFAFFIALHGLWRGVGAGLSIREARPWITVQIVVAPVVLGTAFNSLFRDSNHYSYQWTLNDLLEPIAFMTVGIEFPRLSILALFLGAGVAVVIFLAALVHERTRATSLCYFILPIVTALVVSNLVTPIYGFRLLSNASALVPLVLGLMFAERARQAVPARLLSSSVLTVCAVTIAVGGVIQVVRYEKPHRYALLADQIREIDGSAATVVAPSSNPATAWAMARYLEGPRWGSVFDIQPPTIDKWRAVYRRLPAPVTAYFSPESDVLETDTLRLGMGLAAADRLSRTSSHIWTVSTFRPPIRQIPGRLDGREPEFCIEEVGIFGCRYDLGGPPPAGSES